MIQKVLRKMRSIILPNAEDRALQKWRADQGDIILRQEYSLTPSSVVLDLGGFKGQWASDIFSRYQSVIHIFEPVPDFSRFIINRFQNNPKVFVHNFGLGGKTRQEQININSDGSSIVRYSNNKLTIDIYDIKAWLNSSQIKNIDLLKINIEGGEYELLERMIEQDMLADVINFQIQFHNFFPEARFRMESIRRALLKTHKQTYCYDFVWENWRRI
jgi:FkbM family methyltransferase